VNVQRKTGDNEVNQGVVYRKTSVGIIKTMKTKDNLDWTEGNHSIIGNDSSMEKKGRIFTDF
jgi:hypothetical protein